LPGQRDPQPLLGCDQVVEVFGGLVDVELDPPDAAGEPAVFGAVVVADPPGAEARAARWRDHLAGKKILLLLDDAVGHEQVRPLLPGTAGSLVLITSRRRLTALADAAVVSLDVLPPDEAAALLTRLAGRPGLAAGGAAVREITRLGGYLPLAIGMLASQLRHHPAWTAASLAAELADTRDRLAVMHAENLSVATAFDLSYADLTEDQQRLFRAPTANWRRARKRRSSSTTTWPTSPPAVSGGWPAAEQPD
jgi:hypothetical protein